MITIECSVRVNAGKRQCRWKLTAESVDEATRMHIDHLQAQHGQQQRAHVDL